MTEFTCPRCGYKFVQKTYKVKEQRTVMVQTRVVDFTKSVQANSIFRIINHLNSTEDFLIGPNHLFCPSSRLIPDASAGVKPLGV